MNPFRRIIPCLAGAALGLAVAAPAVAEDFTISLEELVAEGVQGPGAGFIGARGEIDTYTFTGVAGTPVYFDEVAGSCSIAWECVGPDGVLFTDSGFCISDPQIHVLPADGEYVISVLHETDGTGAYSFIAWDVNPDDAFMIGPKDLVADGLPGPGAGNIEEAGTRDIYTFDGVVGQTVYFDELAGTCGVAWSVLRPDDSVLFTDSGFCISDPGAFVLDQTGTYTVIVDGEGDVVGTYSFTIWEVNRDDVFAIGLKDLVADGLPGPGAGNIEEAGTRDIYTFDGVAGQEVYFDELAGNCGLAWSVLRPDDSVLFTDGGFCISDPGAYVLDQTGSYTVIVVGEGDVVGTYSFTIWEVNPDEVFAIELEETVADGLPAAGAGNIEEAGTSDVYELVIDAPTTIYVDELAGACGIEWTMFAPDGTEVFSDGGFCIVDPELYDLDQVGAYELVVTGENDATGTYSFVLWDLNPDDEFAVALGDTISEDVPGPGAGHIEEPGTRDVYTVALTAGIEVCFVELAGACNLAWSVEGPDGVLFTDSGFCSSAPGSYLIPATGTYTITVDGEGDATGTYSFRFRETSVADIDDDCDVDFEDLVALLAAWGTPDADLNGDGNTGFDDLVVLLSAWG